MNILAAFAQALVPGLLKLLAEAGMGLPLIALLSLVAGRRGMAGFCLEGALRLLRLAGILALFGPVRLFAGYAIQLRALGARDLLGPLFSLAGAPYLAFLAAWLCGWGLVALAACRLKRMARSLPPEAEKYPGAFIRPPAFFCLLASFCYLAALILASWPFAGLPPDLPLERAATAIARDALRHYFMALCPAGALGLCAALLWIRQPHFRWQRAQATAALRWLAVWAAVGRLPHFITNAGLAIGMALRGPLGGQLAGGFHGQALSLSFLALAIICWALIAICKSAPRLAAWLALALLFLSTCSPDLARLWSSRF